MLKHTSPVDEDLSNINLLPMESILLFWYSHFTHFDGGRLGRRLDGLYKAGLVVQNWLPSTDRHGRAIPVDSFSVSEKYFRYQAYWRNQILKGSVWPAIVSGVVSYLFNLWVRHM